MCGLAGFWGPPDRELLEAMTRLLSHRGPDDEGFFESPGASLGHRRLSIIDLPHGHQPMASDDGAVQVAYNGEIYNYRELRAQLEAAGHRFRTDCDTEVLLRAFEEHGTGCFERFNGMWALAVLDRRGGRLVLARDHFGIKPLYTAEAGERLLFASEIKALLADPSLECGPDEQRVHDYLTRGFHDHDARTFFEGVRQVPPATWLQVSDDGITEHRYWSPQLSEDGPADPAAFRQLFEKAVERRLVADVPVGTCLSGGLDSSSIVCLMTDLLRSSAPDARSLGGRLRTFSAVFGDDPIDERSFIEPVLAATGAERNFVEPTSERFVEEIGDVVWHQDEPMVSTGPYAQWCVMRLAGSGTKVLLDGQAGDELLAGYVPYHLVYLRQLIRRGRWRTALAEAWAARDVLVPQVRRRLHDRGLGRQRTLQPASLLDANFRRRTVATPDPRSRDDLKVRLLQDLTTYSLPSLLRYEDRNSMAHSIESRIPYLDQELVEWVLALPPEAIIRAGWSRDVLRRAMAGVLPERIRLRRWKVGFTTPEMRWLTARRAVVQGVLRSPAFASRPWWDGPSVARAFAEACEGRVEASLVLWRVINVELWLRIFFGPSGHGRKVAALGDAEAVALLASAEAAALSERFAPNWERHLFCVGPCGRRAFARVPLRAPLVAPGDDLQAALDQALAPAGRPVELHPGDIVAISEKVVAISQRRSFPVDQVRAGPLAVGLSRFVRRTRAGIGLGIPATMQLAIDEVGTARILLAAAAGGITRALGVRGTFFRVAGGRVGAIDGPTAGTIAPYDTHAKLPPADPDGVAAAVSSALSARAGGRVGVAVVDANDIGVQVLGATAEVDRALLVWLLADNPLGQGSEQTPVALVRQVGEVGKFPVRGPARPGA